MKIHRHSFDNVMKRLSTDENDNVHIEICNECMTVKVTYEGKKPKYVHNKRRRLKRK